MQSNSNQQCKAQQKRENADRRSGNCRIDFEVMNFKQITSSSDTNGRFNMTPIIDIVFLLIIFFMLVCQFIVAENFEVRVPDKCNFARQNPEPGSQITTITVMKAGADEVSFAVGPETIIDDRTSMAEKIGQAVDQQLNNLPVEQRMVRLRVDKDICFYDVQYALAGIAESCAVNIELSALKNARPGIE